MVELVINKLRKQTPNKLRWDGYDAEGVNFELYIFKWRVPEPWPQRIHVTIEPSTLKEKPQKLTPKEVKTDPSLRKHHISAIVQCFKHHTKTLQYRPIEAKAEWEIGEPYIPYSLTHNDSEFLKLTVKWDKLL